MPLHQLTTNSEQKKAIPLLPPPLHTTHLSLSSKHPLLLVQLLLEIIVKLTIRDAHTHPLQAVINVLQNLLVILQSCLLLFVVLIVPVTPSINTAGAHPPVRVWVWLLRNSGEDVVKVVIRCNRRGPWGMGKTTVHAGVVYHLCDQSCPTGLMRSTEASSVVTVEELIEPDVITPVGVVVEHINSSIAGAAPVIVARKDMLEAVLELFRNLAEVHVIAGALGALNLERAAVEHVETQQ